MPDDVLRVSDMGLDTLSELLSRYSLRLESLASETIIPGSYWGDSEAGLVGDMLYARHDTPIHSVLHEAAHFVCMDGPRRASLHQDAGGDHGEENAVCYLQILWADLIPGLGRVRMWRDMDAWGYTFRLGSAQRWFEDDADDARDWLVRHGIVSGTGALTGHRRV